ncbi:hypothetical protein LMG27952_03144 [Paraburkholderia hiiakae]|uniref:Phage tail assembly chaperone n=1 Tax=Paraburkholderia hiiakae TaxID=1081782 RepID=A0ABM8NPB8_9BURK|nr:hypothetical protein [Paraburkholderia hiiakae]CAD6536405.1 hypothetical protein LMG27952_03144 [Paraburkholderia hiiakae]
MLTREMILAARDLGFEVVEVPEWGGEVRIGVMSGKVREALMDVLAEKQPVSRFQALMLASTIVDENGAPLFGPNDVEQLSDKNTDVLVRLVGVAMRINKIGAGATEEAEKNSEAALSGSSGTASPAN